VAEGAKSKIVCLYKTGNAEGSGPGDKCKKNGVRLGATKKGKENQKQFQGGRPGENEKGPFIKNKIPTEG